ncbi:HAD hydrolase family protein [Thermogymnomonas acidicola]|uniref:HAD hydrolase family protein n=1 Tax=Thermogymnomonas acidicola TaxID=399579 RepID=UPI001396BFAC|nr:HAD hydrolase family protein [Thermogymnomonas acidicola]
MIRLILSDVDGTITHRDRRIDVAAIEAIRKAIGRGILVSLVSGNVIPVMYGLEVFIGLNAPAFAENGGCYIMKEHVEAFFSKEKPEEFLRHIERITSAYGIFSNAWRLTSMGFGMREDDEERVREEAKKFGGDRDEQRLLMAHTEPPRAGQGVRFQEAHGDVLPGERRDTGHWRFRERHAHVQGGRAQCLRGHKRGPHVHG